MVQVEVCWLCPDEYTVEGVECGDFWGKLLACTEAVCTSRVGEGTQS